MSLQDPRRSSPIIPARPYLRADPDNVRRPANEAAAGIVRSQIDTIYGSSDSSQPSGDDSTATSTSTDNHTDQNPYDRTHEANRTELQEEQWRQYHSAWQDYYRQYYERYYLGEIYRIKHPLGANLTSANQKTSSKQDQLVPEQPADNHEAVHDLRSNLRRNIHSSASKVRKSRHFTPLLAAGLTMVLFLFLQYNRVLFANVEAYVSPGTIDPASIIVDPNLAVPVSSEPQLIIPKINVKVPVVYDTKPDQASQLAAMTKGVGWFGIPGANSRPGQVGNTVLSGHSSNDLFDPGDYKFIFARLDQLVAGDTFHLHYEGVRYTYSVTKKEVVAPTDVQKLIYDTEGKPVVTLITCVPVGTAQSRLLVTAEQISPNPDQADEAPEAPVPEDDSAAMPGNSPTFVERLFGA